MKSTLLGLVFLAAAVSLPTLSQAGQEVQLLLKEEKVYNDEKDCYYAAEINLGQLAQAKPFQILRETGENHFEPMRFSHHIVFNSQREMVLHIGSSASSKKDKACAPSQSVLFLN